MFDYFKMNFGYNPSLLSDYVLGLINEKKIKKYIDYSSEDPKIYNINDIHYNENKSEIYGKLYGSLSIKTDKYMVIYFSNFDYCVLYKNKDNEEVDEDYTYNLYYFGPNKEIPQEEPN